jgi:hypothetical protein
MAKNKKKNLKLNVSNLYILAAFAFILGFGFFGTSKLFMAEDIPINQSPLHEEMDLRANGKFSINDWTYDKEQGLMEVTLVTNGIQDYMTQLDFTAVSRENLSRGLPTEIVYNESDIYVIHIKDVPKDFNQMALRMNKDEKEFEDLFAEDTKSEEAEEGQIISTIYTDERVVKEEQIQDKNFNEYALEITEELIAEAQKDIEKLEGKIVVTDDIIAEIQLEIERLQTDLLYQTVEEQVETNNDVFDLQKDIEDYEKEKQVLNEDIKNLQYKMERLKQKQYDLNI